MARSDTFHADGVRRLYEVTRRVSGSTDLAEVLEEIAQGVVEGLGYGVAAISRLEGDTLVMTAVGGPRSCASRWSGGVRRPSLILGGVLDGRPLGHPALPAPRAAALGDGREPVGPRRSR